MGIKFPTPWKTLIIKFPPPRDGKGVKCPGYAWGGGMLKLRFDRYITTFTFNSRFETLDVDNIRIWIFPLLWILNMLKYHKVIHISSPVMPTLPLLAGDLRFFESFPALPLCYINLPLVTSTINIEYLFAVLFLGHFCTFLVIDKDYF